jgi:DNA repair protein RadC
LNQHKSIKYWAEDERPREKLLRKGAEALSVSELLSILIGSGAKGYSAVDLARNILNYCSEDITLLSRLNPDELQKVKGIGPAKAILIRAAFELSTRRLTSTGKKLPLIGSSKDAYVYLGPILSSKNYEEFWILLLNRRNQIIKPYKVSEGGISGTVADPRRIFKTALENSASGMILCHNHPSGNLKPSEADIRLTKKIKAGGDQLDISILDHIIIAGTSYYSFADEGQL